MSDRQEYSPPEGTKYKWGTKALNYSPWVCRFFSYWPACIVARVELKGNKFLWVVETTGFKFESTYNSGSNRNALQACLDAESFCEEEKARIWLPWMDIAVAAGWRPPCING